MSGKRPSLAESMQRVARPEPADPLPAPSEAVRRPPMARPGFYAATRAGKKKVTAALEPAKHKQLKSLALDRDTTTEALLAEAIDDLLTKHRKAG